MFFTPSQCNSQGKNIRVFKVAFRQLKKEAGCFGKIIKCESSLDGCKFRSESLGLRLLAKDG
tara:strand:+ start:9124 stop:9309 length:186 start_codon:yes stop_codon:yes gene_type:complete